MSSQAMESYVAPSFFLTHGGGPSPILGDPDSVPLVNFLNTTARDHLRLMDGVLKAIILVTAHWESPEIGISSSSSHHLYYDYYNFPVESYTFQYPAPGAPELARRVHAALTDAGIESYLDPDRGWDHGVFVPMILLRPEADIPILQMSLSISQDTDLHWRIGEALRPFRQEGIAIIGSGMSYHNMKWLRSPQGNVTVNVLFDEYLIETSKLNLAERKESLKKWREAEEGLSSHPYREAEHFMPFVVNAAAGSDAPGEKILNWEYHNIFRVSSFVWN